MKTISNEQRRWRIGHRHLLAASAATNDVEAIATALVGLHSSDPATVFLSCLARMAKPSIEAVEQALYRDRSVVRHHAMRRTIWVMNRRTSRLAYAATTKKIAAAERKRNVKSVSSSMDLADPGAWFDAATAEAVACVRKSGLINTREVGKRLPHLVRPLEFGSANHSSTLNAHTKVLQGAAFDGTIVRGQPSGSWISSEYPWAVTSDWLGEPIAGLDEREAAAELVDLWLRQFGPATEVDMVWWFGGTKTLIRNALADSGAEQVRLEDGAAGWVARGDSGAVEKPEPWVRLLPGLDSTSMGWKQRDFTIDAEFVHPMFDQFGNIGPAIWADGRIVGGWIQRDDATVATELFTELSNGQLALLDIAIEQLMDAVGDVVVRPRFPARMSKRLLSS